MGYFAKDNSGEVWIRGANIASGYYKDEKKTQEDFDEGSFRF
jgi:long-subunit acyl-CoA synthetase (AMP-forming)